MSYTQPVIVWLSVAQYAKWKGVNTDTVRRWIKDQQWEAQGIAERTGERGKWRIAVPEEDQPPLPAK